MTITAIQQNSVPTEMQSNDVARMAAPQSRAAPDHNGVVEHGAQQGALSQGSPIDGGRESTTNQAPGWEEREAMAEDRAMRDPEYAKLKAQLETWGNLEEAFAHMASKVGWQHDGGAVVLSDILALVNDVHADPKARELAKLLNDNRHIWNKLAKGDDRIGPHDVAEFLSQLKADVAGRKDAARAEINSELGIGTAANAAAASGGAAAATSDAKDAATTDVKLQLDQANPKPAPSEYSGLEGATENMNNMIGWGEGEIDRLTELMGKTDDPATLKQLENKINQMTRRMQQMTALMNQLSTAMQNISKMYSDIAMNSVRNMK